MVSLRIPGPHIYEKGEIKKKSTFDLLVLIITT